MKHKYTEKAKKIFSALAEIVREERLKQNKSQRLLSFEYELSKSIINRIEKGTGEAQFISIWVAAEALGMKPSKLIRKIENKLPENFLLIED